MSQVTFQAIISKVQTTTDGGWRVYLDLSELDGASALKLAQMRNDLVQFAAITTPEPVGYRAVRSETEDAG